MKCLVVIAVLVGAVAASLNHADNIPKMFAHAMEKYNKGKLQELLAKRSHDEINERLRNFEKHVSIVEDCNDDHSISYTAATNFMSVMTDLEKQALLSLDKMNMTSSMVKREATFVKRQVPSSVDWKRRGAQPAVKDQGRCGSCWAFAAVSALEGRYFALTGDLVAFSEQEYLNCAVEDYARKNPRDTRIQTHDGCDGGWMHWAFGYSQTAGRMASMKDFPYLSKDEPCDMDGVVDSMEKASVTGTNWYNGNDDRLTAGVVEGVVTVAIKVVDKFSVYRTGIWSCMGTETNGCNCEGHPNHAVTVVGYTENAWDVRNSWSASWGDGGYIKMSRSVEHPNICGINVWAQAPALECKAGQTCDGWNDGDEENQEEEEEKEEEDFDIGQIEKCGEIEHFGGLCVDLDDTAARYATLTSAGCSRSFCITTNGYIQDSVTEMCLTVEQDVNNMGIRFAECKDAKTWQSLRSAFRLNEGNGKCWHPVGGSDNPEEDTNVVIYDGCDSDRTTFTMKPTLCWEEYAESKLFGKIKTDTGRKLRSRRFSTAKNMCMETEGCNGLHYNGKTYLLCKSKDTKSASEATNKAFVMKPCGDTCESGTMRCADEKCRESCDGDDSGECPSATTRCNDGVCRHEHMC